MKNVKSEKHHAKEALSEQRTKELKNAYHMATCCLNYASELRRFESAYLRNLHVLLPALQTLKSARKFSPVTIEGTVSIGGNIIKKHRFIAAPSGNANKKNLVALLDKARDKALRTRKAEDMDEYAGIAATFGAYIEREVHALTHRVEQKDISRNSRPDKFNKLLTQIVKELRERDGEDPSAKAVAEWIRRKVDEIADDVSFIKCVTLKGKDRYTVHFKEKIRGRSSASIPDCLSRILKKLPR